MVRQVWAVISWQKLLSKQDNWDYTSAGNGTLWDSWAYANQRTRWISSIDTNTFLYVWRKRCCLGNVFWKQIEKRRIVNSRVPVQTMYSICNPDITFLCLDSDWMDGERWFRKNCLAVVETPNIKLFYNENMMKNQKPSKSLTIVRSVSMTNKRSVFRVVLWFRTLNIINWPLIALKVASGGLQRHWL